jgi:hypothetical protein
LIIREAGAIGRVKQRGGLREFNEDVGLIRLPVGVATFRDLGGVVIFSLHASAA